MSEINQYENRRMLKINIIQELLTDPSVGCQKWKSICYGNGKFVAIAEGTDEMSDSSYWNTTLMM